MSANPFIYFGGDSFMAGSELADDTLQCWKDMFGRYAGPDARYHTEFFEAKTKEMHDWSDSQYAQYMCCQQDRLWTTLVCDKHGIKHHNDGAGASSQEAVVLRAVISFDKFDAFNFINWTSYNNFVINNYDKNNLKKIYILICGYSKG